MWWAASLRPRYPPPAMLPSPHEHCPIGDRDRYAQPSCPFPCRRRATPASRRHSRSSAHSGAAAPQPRPLRAPRRVSGSSRPTRGIPLHLQLRECTPPVGGGVSSSHAIFPTTSLSPHHPVAV